MGAMKAWLLLAGCAAAALGQAAQPPAASTQRRIVAAIGIGRYQNSGAWRDVITAEASAVRVQALLMQEFGYQAANGSPLTGAATEAKIGAYVDSVTSGLGETDDLIFFYAGHGVSLPQSEGVEGGFLVPYNAPANPSPSGLIGIEELLKRLAQSRARNVLVILDACETGVAVPRFGIPDTGRQEQGSSRILITAAAAHQNASADGGTDGTTLFTGTLLDLLKSGDCDVSGEGYCTATQIGLLARRRLSELKTRQTPLFGSFGGDEAAEFRIPRLGAETVDWMRAKACDTTTAECLETGPIEAFLREHPAGVYAAAARKELRDRAERAIRSKGTVTISDLRMVAGSGARASAVWNEEGATGDSRLVFMWVPGTKTPFWMGKYEVSVEQYRRFLRGAAMPRAPSFNRSWNEDGEQPIVNVSWLQARQYCAALGGELPTFAQWEAAAQYGSSVRQRFPWNDEELRDRANLAGAKEDGHLFAAAVRAFAAGENALGIRNLIGNVSEWTLDRSKDDPGKAVVAGYSFADRWEKADLRVPSEVDSSGSNTVGFRCIVVPGQRQ